MFTVVVTGSRDWTDLAPVQRDLFAVWSMVLLTTGDPQQHMRVVQGGQGTWRTLETKYMRSNVPSGRIKKVPVRGADAFAKYVARNLGDGHEGVIVKTEKADWDTFGKAAGPLRNQQMLVRWEPDLVLAYHPTIRKSKGTRDCINRAYKMGFPIILRPNLQTYIPIKGVAVRTVVEG